MFQKLGLGRWLILPELNPQDPSRNKQNELGVEGSGAIVSTTQPFAEALHGKAAEPTGPQASRGVMPGEALDSPWALFTSSMEWSSSTVTITQGLEDHHTEWLADREWSRN